MYRALYRLVFVCSLIVPGLNAPGLGMSHSGNAPVGEGNYTDWPGIVPVINNPSRVYQVWVNGGETNYFRGEMTSLNQALDDFSKADAPVHEVFILPGPAKANPFGDGEFAYDWRLNLLGGVSRFLLEEEIDTQVYIDHPTLTVFIGDGNIELDKLVVPAGITLVPLADLRERYYRGLRSRNERVRRAAVGRLSEFDPYSEETFARITGTHAETFTGEETWIEFTLPRIQYIDPAIMATRLQHFGKPARPILVKQLERTDLKEERLEWVRKAIQAIDDTPEDPEAKVRFLEREAAIAAFVRRQRATASAPR